MDNWIELSDIEYKKVWDKIDQDFRFRPSMSEFPSFIVPSPFITYDVSDYLNWPGELDILEEIYNDLENKSLLAFQELMKNDDYFYALDWQHPCYWVNPFLPFPRDVFNEWLIPILPDGDYYFFIQKDFNWGFLGHPWEKTITIFGKDLIQVFQNHTPRMFHAVLRTG